MKTLSQAPKPSSRAGGRAAPAAVRPPPVPELHFRSMPPSEAVVRLAREQDALYRGVVLVDRTVTRVTMERRTTELGERYYVLVRAEARGAAKCGCAEHEVASIALLAAYTALLRHTVDETSCPCSQAA